MTEASLGNRLRKKMLRAISEYEMFPPGSRIAVAVSGGKDSMAVTKLLTDARERNEINCSLHILHVRMPHLDPDGIYARILEDYFSGFGNEFSIIELNEEAKSLIHRKKGRIDCFRCSWVRKKLLFLSAGENGCNIIVTGHHSDDLAQTVIMNMSRHGRCETMEPKVSFFGGEIILTRPAAFIREKELAIFAKQVGFPITGGCTSACSFSVRSKAGEIIRDLSTDNPLAVYNILKSAGIRIRPSGKRR